VDIDTRFVEHHQRGALLVAQQISGDCVPRETPKLRL
jgi:hypothetical protein